MCLIMCPGFFLGECVSSYSSSQLQLLPRVQLVHLDLLVSSYDNLPAGKYPHFTDEEGVTKQLLIFLSKLLLIFHFEP